jgi:hypothetical protein
MSRYQFRDYVKELGGLGAMRRSLMRLHIAKPLPDKPLKFFIDNLGKPFFLVRLYLYLSKHTIILCISLPILGYNKKPTIKAQRNKLNKEIEKLKKRVSTHFSTDL